MHKIQALNQYILDNLETRENNRIFWKELKDNPLRNLHLETYLLHELSHGSLDSYYWALDKISRQLADFDYDEYQPEDDFSEELLDFVRDNVEADIYNTDLLEWLSMSLDHIGYCDEAISEFGLSSETQFMNIVGMGQKMMLDEFGSTMINKLFSYVPEQIGEMTKTRR